LFEKYTSGPFWVGIIIAVLGGLLMSVRTIGVIFPIAVLIWAIRKRFIDKDKSPMTKCVCGFLVGVGSILFYLLLNELIFNIPQAEGGSYAGIWGEENLYTTVVLNLAYYTDHFQYFFAPWGGLWNFLPLILGSVIFTFTLLGMLRSFFKRLELIDMIVILYLGVLVIYPYRHGGIRFLVPIMPFLLYYLARGLELVNLFPRISRSAKIIFLGCLVLVSYLNMFWYILQTDHLTLNGPQEANAVEAIEYIRENTGAEDVILFAKPRVLALYSERNCLANHVENDSRQIADLIFAYNVAWVLTHTEISDDAIHKFIKEQDNLCEYFWSNDKFVLYRVSP
jgi:hypothetical protein